MAENTQPRFPLHIKSSDARLVESRVTIYQYRNGNYRQFKIAYRDATGRHFEARSTFEAAQKRANEILQTLENREANDYPKITAKFSFRPRSDCLFFYVFRAIAVFLDQKSDMDLIKVGVSGHTPSRIKRIVESSPCHWTRFMSFGTTELVCRRIEGFWKEELIKGQWQANGEFFWVPRLMRHAIKHITPILETRLLNSQPCYEDESFVSSWLTNEDIEKGIVTWKSCKLNVRGER